MGVLEYWLQVEESKVNELNVQLWCFTHSPYITPEAPVLQKPL